MVQEQSGAGDTTFERVTVGSFQELGRLLSLCLTSKCDARTLP